MVPCISVKLALGYFIYGKNSDFKVLKKKNQSIEIWFLSAILPLLDVMPSPNILTFTTKTWKMVLRCHKKQYVFPHIWAYALQNVQFKQNF